MKRHLLLGIAILTVASPAMALRITNLDKIPHRVQFTGKGEPEVRDIAPGDTAYFTDNTGGFVSLLTAPNPKPSKGSVHSDGLLSGVIGAARTQNIPVDPDNNYSIWPDGKILLQNRVKRARR